MRENNLEALLQEDRQFTPSEDFRNNAVIQDASIYEHGKSPDFWKEQADNLSWFSPWEILLVWNPPFALWFIGGKINASYNCLDRHLKDWHRNKAAIIFEGENGDSRVLTYQDLHREVCKFANVLKNNGVSKGDRVTIYLPMIPEAVIAMLACARIGAPHSVVFGGFSSEALRDRVIDAQAKAVITSDGSFRRGNTIPLKDNTDIALEGVECVEHVFVIQRTKQPVQMKEGRDLWYHEEMQKASPVCPAEPMDAEDMLFILYTSGTTGKPKGVVHTTGGYMVGVSTTHRWVFDLKEEDVYWCTADVGWITGHSYIVYGPLANGATVLIYEGSPDYPQRDRFWEIVEKYKVTILYTAPTAIRTFMKWGPQYPQSRDLSSLRLLGTVGEPINPEAWMWYWKHVGKERCQIVDAWWQTETGGHMIAPFPGAIPTKPGSATKPFYGVQPVVLSPEGKVQDQTKSEGVLAIADSWPGQARTIWGDHGRFVSTYFETYKGYYFTGDGCRRDEDGYYWITGRDDDVLNVSGHRLGTAEVESALVAHPKVSEAAVVGYPHSLKGQGIYCYVTLMAGETGNDDLGKELKAWVLKEIGPIATPDLIQFTPGLPKTRSGKIMRRILRKVAENDFGSLGDTSTLADPSVVDNIGENRMNK